MHYLLIRIQCWFFRLNIWPLGTGRLCVMPISALLLQCWRHFYQFKLSECAQFHSMSLSINTDLVSTTLNSQPVRNDMLPPFRSSLTSFWPFELIARAWYNTSSVLFNNDLASTTLNSQPVRNAIPWPVYFILTSFSLRWTLSSCVIKFHEFSFQY